MILIADSSALVALAVCDGLSLLDSLFEVTKVPKTVFEEVSIYGKAESSKLRHYLTAKIVDIDLSEYVIADVSLDIGELDAMALYKKLKADKFLVDDRQAKKIAIINNLDVIGSLGILLLAKQKGLIATVKPYIEKIQHSDIYLAEHVYHDVLELAGEQ